MKTKKNPIPKKNPDIPQTKQPSTEQEVPKENRVASSNPPASDMPHYDPTIENALPLSSSVDPKGNDPRHPSQGGSEPHHNETPYDKGKETPVNNG